MRATLFLLLSTIILGLFLWITLSGALLVFGLVLWVLFLVITIGYSDTFILYLLGAREVRSSDQKDFFEAASQEAYKLSVSMPRLYFYNGSLERAFVLQSRKNVSVILNKALLEKCTFQELSAISFELLLQVKKGMAPKRTKSMFILGFLAWTIHSTVGLIMSLIPFKDMRKASDWVLSYLLHPLLDFLFKSMMGEKYFRRLQHSMDDFPFEKDQLQRVGMKLRKPFDYYSIPSRKLLELSSVNKSRHFQNMLALEFLPHEWDFLFQSEDLKRAE